MTALMVEVEEARSLRRRHLADGMCSVFDVEMPKAKTKYVAQVQIKMGKGIEPVLLNVPVNLNDVSNSDDVVSLAQDAWDNRVSNAVVSITNMKEIQAGLKVLGK